MEVLVLQVFVSLCLVAGSLILFAYTMRQRNHEHADRLALFPLEEETSRLDHAAPNAVVPTQEQSK